jgi:antitoxin component of RelBE/YafQ-DinJ toxin-antitoxin module
MADLDPTDIRVLVPRVRRALEGTGQPVLTDDQVKDQVADAIADIILLTSGAFDVKLAVTATENGAPTEYRTERELTLPEGSAVAAQAAMKYLMVELQSFKTSETIRDEGQEWTWATSTQATTQRIKDLGDFRDRAIAAIMASKFAVDSFDSFLEQRDMAVARRVEPRWARP